MRRAYRCSCKGTVSAKARSTNVLLAREQRTRGVACALVDDVGHVTAADAATRLLGRVVEDELQEEDER